MSIYTHHGWLGFVPHGSVERHQEVSERQQQWEEEYHGTERCDFGPTDEDAARVFLRDGGMGEIDLGRIMAQADRNLQREGDG